MGYPWDKTYLEQIQENEKECKKIRGAFYVLRNKYVADSDKCQEAIELGIKENFAILGEAFELASDTVDGIPDAYHFLWDILDALLTPKQGD